MDLLITGASSGIAPGLADEARSRGWRLARVCRASDASWVTGQVIGLDGAFSAVRPPVRAA